MYSKHEVMTEKCEGGNQAKAPESLNPKPQKDPAYVLGYQAWDELGYKASGFWFTV